MIRRNNIVLSGMIFKTFTTFRSYCKKKSSFLLLEPLQLKITKAENGKVLMRT